MVRTRKGEFVDLFDKLNTQGYGRVRVDGVVHPLTDPPKLKKQEKHDIEVVVDRLTVKASAKQRLTDSVETALNLAEGIVVLDFVDREEHDPHREQRFSEKLACPNGHPLAVDDRATVLLVQLALRRLPGVQRPGHPQGGRSGPGRPGSGPDPGRRRCRPVGDGPQLRVLHPDDGRPRGGAGFDVDTPWRKLPAKARKAILGAATSRCTSVTATATAAPGRTTPTSRASWRSAAAHGADRLELMKERYEGSCATCRARSATAPGSSRRSWRSPWRRGRGAKSIAEVCGLSIADCSTFLNELTLGPREQAIAGQVLKEVQSRLGFLLDVGLDYLTLSRAAGRCPAGGAAHPAGHPDRLRAGGVLYVLDEPSIGLHQRDNRRLIETLTRLRDLGNTLIVVEHDEDTIAHADWIVDIGPAAGEHGGRVVHSGPTPICWPTPTPSPGRSCPANRASRYRQSGARWTAKATHRGRRPRTQPAGNRRGLPARCAHRRHRGFRFGQVHPGQRHPATVLANKLNGARLVPGRHTRVNGLEHVDKLVRVDQSPIGERRGPTRPPTPGCSTRSAPVRRDHRGQGPRLPARPVLLQRQGRPLRGLLRRRHHQDRDELPARRLRPCEVCHGARYNRETLEVHYKGKTISEVLDLSIEDACEFFEPISSIHRYLKTLVDVGLGYVRLGQPGPTLSGGEAQRVKLAAELQKRSTGRTVYILDEPTTGLHFEDIRKLLKVINGLVDKGNSVIVIEHNLDVIKTSDWIIDMGPRAAPAAGPWWPKAPEEVAAVEQSYTGGFLAGLLEPPAPKRSSRRRRVSVDQSRTQTEI